MYLEEDAQWGVVQWSPPERLLELWREQGGMHKASVQHEQYMLSLCMSVHSAVKYIHNTKILYIIVNM